MDQVSFTNGLMVVVVSLKSVHSAAEVRVELLLQTLFEEGLLNEEKLIQVCLPRIANILHACQGGMKAIRQPSNLQKLMLSITLW